ncbi:MAG TPA: HAMP domain-containing sensor histidine kinase [Bacteroidia bacterium]|nr:HAMP domain-containing sensor histidine kinase [Bacteroidia bacterium]
MPAYLWRLASRVNIYSRKQLWKWLLLVAAAIIVAASLIYTFHLEHKISQSEKRNVELWAEAVRRKAIMMEETSQLYSKISKEERKKMEILANASRLLVNFDPDRLDSKDTSFFEFIFRVIKSNETVPAIVTDGKGHIEQWRNLDTAKSRDPAWRYEQLKIMRAQHDSIFYINDTLTKKTYYMFYRNSQMFDDIRESFESNERSFIKEVASNPASAPAIYTDSTSSTIIAYGNLDTLKLHRDSLAYLHEALNYLKENGDTIMVSISEGRKNVIYYMESPQLQQLRYFPIVQVIVVGMFLLVAYLLFSTSRRAEQNLVWVGMAKETAHQLGTPLSSLIAWMEYLKMKGVDESILKEIGQDIRRLEMITERFSKIGSQPRLGNEDVVDALSHAVDYMRSRTSKTVTFNYSPPASIFAPLNVPLFAWVIENLCRNAVDAMDGTGSITIEVFDEQQFVYIDITDTGKGIPRSKQKTIFEPGFTTKQRGWGLGLSLCKRIIEQYHKGEIFVKRSLPGKGTTFRIVLKK